MTVADAIARWLTEKGITHVFGIIGGGNVALWDSISRQDSISLISCHHEQAATMAAAYYQRSSGRIAGALVTTGAGSTNALTGAAAAFMDGIPVLIISGNEASKYMDKPTRVWGVQGYDSVMVASRLTKLSYRAKQPSRITQELSWLTNFALEAPQGPVWLDVPKDVQNALV